MLALHITIRRIFYFDADVGLRYATFSLMMPMRAMLPLLADTYFRGAMAATPPSIAARLCR